MLLLSQSIGEKYVNMLEKAFDGDIDVLTGSAIVDTKTLHVYKTRGYSSDNITSRVRSWIMYYIDVIKIVKKHKIEPDVVFAISNPPINSFLSHRLRKKFKCKIVFMNWDIYPDIIERTFDSALVQIICKAWRKANNFVFPKMDLMLTIGKYMQNSIQTGVKRPISLQVVPMFTDCTKIKPIVKTGNEFCIKYNLLEKKVVLYSGKMGIGHNMDIILDAAKLLVKESGIHFLLIGKGQRYKSVDDRIKNENIENVTLLPFQTEKEFPYALASGDIGLVTQESNLANLFLPSKSYDMMAAGLPIIGICTKDDDLADLIISNSIGEIVTENNPEVLAGLIKKLCDNQQLRDKYSKASRKCAEEYYDESIITKKYRDIFLRL